MLVDANGLVMARAWLLFDLGACKLEFMFLPF